MDLCFRGIFGLQFGIAFTIVVATFISTLFSSLFTLLIPTLVSRYYEASNDTNAILFVTLASDFLVLSLTTLREFLNPSKSNSGWHRAMSIFFLIIIPFQNFFLRLLSTYCGYVATLWTSLTNFELLLSVGLSNVMFVLFMLVGYKVYYPLSWRFIAYTAFKIVFHTTLGLITILHMKLDANAEVHIAGSLSFIFSRIVGSLFVGIAYNFTASLIHRGPRDKFSTLIGNLEVKQKYFIWFTTFTTYLIASLNLGSGELVYFVKAIIIFLSCSLFIEATAFFDSYIQARRSLLFAYANLIFTCTLVFGNWASNSYFPKAALAFNSISLAPLLSFINPLGRSVVNIFSYVREYPLVAWVVNNFSYDSTDMTESIIILSIRSALMYMVIIWIFQLWSQFIQFSSTKNISKIFDPIPLDNATFYEMSGFKVAHKSVPRWTENPSVIKAKIVEMEKRPFNEFEQLDTTISIQFVYSCILGTLGVAVGLYCYGFELWVPLWIIAASYLSSGFLLSKRFKPSLFFVILRIPYVHPDYPRLVFLMYFLFTLFVEGLSLKFVLSMQFPLWVSYWISLILPTLDLIEEKTKRKNLIVQDAHKEAYLAMFWMTWTVLGGWYMYFMYHQHSNFRFFDLVIVFSHYLLFPSNRAPFTSFLFFQRALSRHRLLLISWITIFVLQVIYASMTISWRFCLFVSVTLIGFSVIRILGFISFYYPDDDAHRSASEPESPSKRSISRTDKETHRYYTYKCYQIFILIGLFLCVLYVLPTPSALSTPYFIPLAGKQNCELPGNTNFSLPPICEPRWHSMDLLDLSFLAQISYITSKSDLISTLHVWFPKTCHTKIDPSSFGSKLREINANLSSKSNFLLAHAPDFVLNGGLQPPLSVLFYDFYDTCSNKHFIAIRGSMSLHDWLTDVDLWMESCLYTMTKKILPLLNYIPESSEALIIKLMAAPQLLFSHYFEEHKTYRNYHGSLNVYLQDLISSGLSRDDIIIIGHSLGGGLAKIVGVHSNVTAISISGPGVLLSRHKFGLSKTGIRDYTVDVVTENDIVPLIDTHGGSLYRITCSHNNLHHECHYLTSVIAQLASLCPDKLSRCAIPIEEEFDLTKTNPVDLSLFIHNYLFPVLLAAVFLWVLNRQIRTIFQSTHSSAFDYSPKPLSTNPMKAVIEQYEQSLDKNTSPKKSTKRNADNLENENVSDLIKKFSFSEPAEEPSKDRKFVTKKVRYEPKYPESKQAYQSGSKDDNI